MEAKPSTKVYFASHISRSCTYQDPRMMPVGWICDASSTTGLPIFIHKGHGIPSEISPVGLPPGWSIRMTADEYNYFANEAQGVTQWTDPRLEHSAARRAAWVQRDMTARLQHTINLLSKHELQSAEIKSSRKREGGGENSVESKQSSKQSSKQRFARRLTRPARPRGGEAKKQESKAGHGFEAKTNFEAKAW